MSYNTRNLVSMTLVVICASSVLASHRHLRRYPSNHRPSFAGYNKDYRTKPTITFPKYDTSHWPSSTDDCLRYEVRSHPEAPAYYLYDDQFYDKRCLKALAYLVEPEERAACRTQSDCHHARGYDNECLIQLSVGQGFNFDFDKMRRQEVEWKKFICRGKTLDQCGRAHSPWWRSRFPSSRDDCRIHGRVDRRKQDESNDDWVPWSIGPYGTIYDNDCLSRFANRLGMDNPRNCTQANTHVIHEAREAPPVELPKTLLYATDPPGIHPHLVLPTVITDPDRLTTTPVTTSIPIPKGSIPGNITHESITTGAPIGRKRERDDFPLSPVRTLTQSPGPLATSLPLVSRAHGSATDEWSCIWGVDASLPDPARGMFDVAFGDATIEKTSLVIQVIAGGELEDLGECNDAIGEETERV